MELEFGLIGIEFSIKDDFIGRGEISIDFLFFFFGNGSELDVKLTNIQSQLIQIWPRYFLANKLSQRRPKCVQIVS